MQTAGITRCSFFSSNWVQSSGGFRSIYLACSRLQSFQNVFYIGHFYRTEKEIGRRSSAWILRNWLCRMKVLPEWWSILTKWLIRLRRKSGITLSQGNSFFFQLSDYKGDRTTIDIDFIVRTKSAKSVTNIFVTSICQQATRFEVLRIVWSIKNY